MIFIEKPSKVFLIFLIIFISGCSSFQQVEVLPDDFELYYEDSAMHLEWGQDILEIDTENNAAYTQKKGSGMEMISEFNIEEEKLLEIYNKALENNFFGLQNNYEDPTIMDGGIQVIEIKGQGASKKVTLVNYYMYELDTLSSMILNLVPQEMRDRKFNDLCPEKMTECSNDNSEVCTEWVHYCEDEGNKE